jgi:putative oxidoreductase
MNTVDSGKTVAVDAGLATLRVAVAVTFFAHGAQKVFQFGIAGVTQGFTQMNIPLPTITAPLVAGLELVGGLLLLFGLFTRPIALLLAIDMIGAAAFVHFRNGFFLPNGFEFTFILFAACLTLVITGPGELSVDAVIANRRRARAAPPQAARY